MNHLARTVYFAIAFLLTIASNAQHSEPLDQLIDRTIQRACKQAKIMAQNLEKQKEALPRTFENGKITTCRYNNWVSGFFPGVLWMLYEETRQEELLHYAKLYTARVEPAKQMKSTHDLGFMLYCSYGNGFRITNNAQYFKVIQEGTESLLTRWNPKLGVMRSWDFNKEWQFPVIIDNMMNLEMLCFMTDQTGLPIYREIAEKHANTTIKNHFRPDYSTYHVVSYDTISLKPHAKHTAQGHAHSSAWARGQAWGLYGYTMMYRMTHKKTYLQQARRIAQYITEHNNLPSDKIPYWDFNAPDIPHSLRDASAGAIMASALLELSQLDKSRKAKLWRNVAIEQIRTLSSKAYLAKEAENGGFILKHGVGHKPNNTEIDVPLTYADYYFIEALLRLKKILED